jgi:MFS family permease
VAVKVLRARIAVVAIFFINGFSFASWVPRLPEVKLALGLSEVALGGALFAVAFGALLAMPLAGGLATRLGSRTVTTAGLMLFLLAPIAWALAPSLALLALGFLAIGAAAGATDVAMNAQGVAVERAYGRSILSSLHGMFSLGGMSGALVAAVVIGGGVPLAVHMAAVAGVALPVGLLASLALLPASHDARGGGPSFALPSRGLLVLGAIAFCALLTEGAIGDWSAVYMTMSLGSPGEVAALAFAAFQLTMAAGRFAGDRRLRPGRRGACRGLPDHRLGRRRARRDGARQRDRRHRDAWLLRLHGWAAHHRRRRPGAGPAGGAGAAAGAVPDHRPARPPDRARTDPARPPAPDHALSVHHTGA